MFGLVTKKAIGHTVAKAWMSTAAAPSVKDLIIQLTFVDPSGARRKVKGLIGTCRFVECMHNYVYYII
jgi:hypothetical protein